MNLQEYINGLRKGKSAHRIEKEAMRDPFLSDALDGFEAVGGDHDKAISRLQNTIRRKTKKKNQASIWWAAACILLILGVAVYTLMPEQDNVVVTQDIPKQEVPREQQVVKPSDELTKGFEEAEKKETENEKSIQTMPNLPAERTPAPEIFELNADEPAPIKEDQYKESSENMFGDYYYSESNEKISEIAAKPQTPPQPPAALIVSEDRSAKKAIAQKDSKQLVIKGQVTDENGEALIGAGVNIKGTNEGTITDFDGYFTLKVDSVLNNYINVSYIGFKPLEIKIDPKKDMAIVLREDASTLDEVVVVGYGTSRKRSISGAVSSVEADSDKKISKKPQPIAGYKAYKEYLKANAIQPTDEECATVKGKVRLSFYVNERGRPYDVTVEESLCPSCDKKAIDLIYNGSNWTSGTEQVKINIEFFGK